MIFKLIALVCLASLARDCAGASVSKASMGLWSPDATPWAPADNTVATAMTSNLVHAVLREAGVSASELAATDEKTQRLFFGLIAKILPKVISVGTKVIPGLINAVTSKNAESFSAEQNEVQQLASEIAQHPAVVQMASENAGTQKLVFGFLGKLIPKVISVGQKVLPGLINAFGEDGVKSLSGESFHEVVQQTAVEQVLSTPELAATDEKTQRLFWGALAKIGLKVLPTIINAVTSKNAESFSAEQNQVQQLAADVQKNLLFLDTIKSIGGLFGVKLPFEPTTQESVKETFLGGIPRLPFSFPFESVKPQAADVQKNLFLLDTIKSIGGLFGVKLPFEANGRI